MGTGRRVAGSVLAVVVALATGAAALAAGGEKYQVRLNARDQAAARAVVLRRSDLGRSSTAWVGGPQKPDLSPLPPCANFHPKVSDLVITGAAESRFARGTLLY